MSNDKFVPHKNAPSPTWQHVEKADDSGKTSTAVRCHTQRTVHVVEQPPTAAKVRTYMLISDVPAGDKLHLHTTGSYNANPEKRTDR
jgi:hypothetical protein